MFGLFVRLHFRSREWKVHRWNFCSRGTFVPWNIRSWNFRSCGSFVPWFQELSLPGTFAPVELSFLGGECTKNFHSLKMFLLWNFRSFKMNIPRNMAPIVKKWSKTVAVHLALPLRVRWILAIDLPAVAALFYSPVDFIDALHWCVHWCIELSTDERNKTTPWWIIQRDICFNMSGVSFCWQYFLD